MVTGAMLAEAATVADGKLYVLGGVLTDFWQPPGGYLIETLLIVLIQAEEGDLHNPQFVEVSITTPDGKSGSSRLPVPEVATAGTRAGFFFHKIGFEAKVPGQYVIVVESVSLPIEVHAPQFG
ncbi:hypothetical protein BJF87_10805 [Gordonia sp. CNJ-863]|uniref:Uncharacterized protein n=1 Tax=Gordonia alkanivorans CGMCC 6845 TaxID=1423140 RepID=W9DG28_9ACTN|nr:hypothetical protein V525_20080 [Gordonia alkanivorans CGMCC 6845]OLT40858.1 hypothetical protein BJF87_10805 [Gordonia sp. CNJ-863]